jgi:hypothetical protein
MGAYRNRKYITAMEAGQVAGPWMRTDSSRHTIIASGVVGTVSLQVLGPDGVSFNAPLIAELSASGVYDFMPPGAPYRFISDGAPRLVVFPGTVSGAGSLTTAGSAGAAPAGADGEAVAVESLLLRDALGVVFYRRREYAPFTGLWGAWENLDLEGNAVAVSTPYTSASADNVQLTDLFSTDTASGAVIALTRENNLATGAVSFRNALTGAAYVPAGTEVVALRPQTVRIGVDDSASLVAVNQAFAALFAALTITEANYAAIRVNGPAAGAGIAYTTAGVAAVFGIGAGAGKEVNVGGEIILQSNAEIAGFNAIGGDAGPYILEIELYNQAPGANFG